MGDKPEGKENEAWIPSLKNLVVIDGAPKNEWEDAGIKCHSWKSLMADGKAADNKGELTKPDKDDTYIFSYTSGTTGDSKGVMLSHYNILSVVEAVLDRGSRIHKESVGISYLPYPHSFE